MNRLFRSALLSAVLFFLLPCSARAAQQLIPVGTVIGLQLLDDSVTVAAFEEGSASAAKGAGLKIGDEILTIGERTITCPEDVRLALQEGSADLNITVRRGTKTCDLHLTPEMTEDGPKLGIYLRQGIAGIGTVTFYDPETGTFGTLGHGVNDNNGTLLRMKQGFAYEAEISSIYRGKSGAPGQLKGSAQAATTYGTLLRNTPQGVFGYTPYGWEGEAIPVAEFSEIHTGKAVILSTVSAATPQAYSVEILKIYPPDRSDCRNFLLKVTDPDLLAATGGIVQGMSGSPIIQDGKLVGAVTHVLVNDPTAGYGIFIEKMLDAAA